MVVVCDVEVPPLVFVVIESVTVEEVADDTGATVLV